MVVHAFNPRIYKEEAGGSGVLERTRGMPVDGRGWRGQDNLLGTAGTKLQSSGLTASILVCSAILLVLFFIFSKTGSLSSLELTFRQGWPESELQGSTCLCLPSTGIASICYHDWLFCDLIKLRSSCLGLPYYLSQLSLQPTCYSF